MDASDSRTPEMSLEREFKSTAPFSYTDTGEREAARMLTRTLGNSVQFLFKRRVGTAKVDIIVIAASGVFVLDPKDYWGRKVRANRARDSFVVNGRARPGLADSMRRHIEAVREAVDVGPMPDAPVSGAFCFMNADLPLGRLVVDDVPATTLHGVAKMLKRRGPLTADKRAKLHTYLSEQFPPA
ncbi:hypothetical protein J2X11_001468 [Aeromicrobium panaciterrae]|uniref:NERD domain-containing protein n=1 Tax=Aeromicrobium panaciterrae TaxID=363861 RepID=A0ABU1UN91_9ACTN|nr:nuclease-related domain-containing protein [Aeromicrobium panaciterrae]MDR7086629.1 hypothetical protein [Aeromicrobium panaciterrae]